MRTRIVSIAVLYRLNVIQFYNNLYYLLKLHSTHLMFNQDGIGMTNNSWDGTLI